MADRHEAVAHTASAIALSKLKAIAERLKDKGVEPTSGEARFALSFVNSVRVDTLIRWMEQLRDQMECEADAEKLDQFISNLKE